MSARIAPWAPLLLVLLPSGAAAAERLHAVAAVPRHWPPSYSIDAEGRPRGFAIEVLEALAERAGVEIAYRVEEDFPDALRSLRKGRADLVPDLGITPERRNLFAFTEPLWALRISLFVRHGTPGVRSLADLRGQKVAVVEENAAGVFLRDREVELVVLPDVQSAVFELLAGQVEGLAFPRPVVRALLREGRLEDELREIEPPLFEVKRAVAVRRDRPELVAALDGAVRDFVETAAYRALYQRWHAPPPPFWTVDRVVWAATSMLVVVLLAMAAWRYVSVLRLNRALRAAIGERDGVERALREEEARLRAIKESLAEGLIVADREGRITDVNERVVEILGHSREEIVGRLGQDFLAEAADRAEAEERIARRQIGLSDHYEVRLRRRDGGVVWAEVHGSPLRDAQGRVIGLLAAVVDVTERRRTQETLRRHEEELGQIHKMEALGRLAGGVAHDFNNLLTVVLGNAEALLGSPDRPESEREALEEIVRAGEQAAGLTGRLLSLSRPVPETEAVELDAVVLETRDLLRRVIGEDVKLEVDAEAPGLWVRGDRDRLTQVILNLAVNARDAMPRGGTLRLRTQAHSDDAVWPDGDVERGPAGLLEVSDTGEGIDPEALPHVFEPFFSTKEEGHGTGLGLATVYGVVRQSGGHVEVDSVPGRGTALRIRLPQVAEPAERPEAPARPFASGGEERVLLVEDEPAVRGLAARVLRESGYRVSEAGSAEEALRAVRIAGPTGIDLLVTDVVMPGMGGDELARRLERELGSVPTLFLSGYAAGERVADRLDRGAALLTKPFRARELLAEVRALLERASAAADRH